MIQNTISSALSDVNSYHATRLYVTPVGFEGQINLRFNPDNQKITRSIQKTTGLSIPNACQFEQGERRRFDWLGPDEFRLHVDQDLLGSVSNSLFELSKQEHIQVVDVSDYYTQIAIGGVHAPLLLANVISLDLHQSSFQPQQIKGARFANATISISCFASLTQLCDVHTIENININLEDPTTCYILSVRWSFARYVWDYLMDCTKEFAN